MRKSYTLDPSLVSDEFVEKTSHLGDYYARIGFENNPNASQKRSDNKPQKIGTLLIGENRIPVSIPQLNRINSELFESVIANKVPYRDFKPGQVQDKYPVFVLHQEYNLTIAEMNKIRDLLQDALKVYDMSVKFGL